MPKAQTNTDLYATDFYGWGLATAALIRAKQWADIDLEAVAEEIESLGRGERKEITNRLIQLLLHLLKWQYQPSHRQESHSWHGSAMDQRNELFVLLTGNTTLVHDMPALLEVAYPLARRKAIVAICGRGHLFRHTITTYPIPLTCPWTDAQVLDDDFWPAPKA
jgi:integrase